MTDEAQNLTVEGIVAVRDKQPYVVLFVNNKRIAQLSMAEARNVAMDILQMCARTEADAMIAKFFEEHAFPPPAIGALMLEFRKFRASLDDEEVQTTRSEPRGDFPPEPVK